MPTKDIFGNPIQQPKYKPKSFEQKLREAKARQKYKQFQKEQRAKQIAKFKQTALKSKQGLQKIKQRATDKRLSGIRAKLRGSIYKKE